MARRAFVAAYLGQLTIFWNHDKSIILANLESLESITIQRFVCISGATNRQNARQ